MRIGKIENRSPQFLTFKKFGGPARQDYAPSLTETADWILFSAENAGDAERLVALI
jgi:hypothetical protein